MRRSYGFTLAALLVACDGKPDARTALDVNAPAPGTSEVDRPHVVFTRSSLVIDRLGAAVAAPVTTPSQPSQVTMQSDDPSTVAVDAQGMLIGMRAGSTVVRSVGGGSTLAVTVLGTSALRLVPEAITLEPDREARVVVLDQDGKEVPADSVRWSIPPGAPVAVIRGQVISTGGSGRFELIAEVGGSRAVLPVEVALAGAARLAVSPPRTRMRRGQIGAFQLQGAQGDVRAEWTSSEPGVLSALGGGLFQAVKAGRARACAAALERVSCSDVEVSP